MTTHERRILDQIAAKRAEAEEMLNKAPDGVLGADEQKAWDTLMTAIEALKTALTNRSALDDLDREKRGTRIPGGGGAGDRPFETAARAFNILRAIAGACGLHVDDGPEREISRELALRSGRPVEGFLIPLQALHRPLERRVLTPGGTGAGIIGTFLDESQYVDALRAQIVCARLGARYITGLDTQIDLPRLSTVATATWVADGSGIATDTTEAFDKISLRPHMLGGIVEFTRNMLITSTPAVQDAARNDLVQVLARGIDLAVLAGSGGVQPTGILNTTGLTIVPIGTNGGAMAWPNVLALMEAVQLANAPDTENAFVGNPKIRASLMDTLKFPSVSGSMPIMDSPDLLAGYPFASTTQMPSNGTKGSGTGLSSLIFGSWSEVLIGMWGDGVEVLVNPYGSTQFAAGSVQVRVLVNADVQLRHIGSFAAITDAVAA
jgi:hypothetical protein